MHPRPPTPLPLYVTVGPNRQIIHRLPWSELVASLHSRPYVFRRINQLGGFFQAQVRLAATHARPVGQSLTVGTCDT